MKKRLISLTSLVILVILHISCSKEGNTPPAAKTKTDLITKASWKFEKATAGVAGDISSAIKPCLKDNTITFATNKTGSISESADVCSPSYANNFTWEFQVNETILHLSTPVFPGGSNDFTLVSLTETNLVLSQVMTVAPYPPTTVEVTFKQ